MAAASGPALNLAEQGACQAEAQQGQVPGEVAVISNSLLALGRGQVTTHPASLVEFCLVLNSLIAACLTHHAVHWGLSRKEARS